MAKINPDFSIGNAYEYKPLQIPNMDKVFDGQRWAIERADRLKKEADVAAERKALQEAKLAKNRNAEIAKEQTLLAQRLKFNTTGLHPEAEALVAKEIDRLSTIGGALGNINDMTRPEVRQWNQEVDKLTNRIYEHQQYYKDLGKATTDYQAAVLDKDLEPYNPQENYEYYQTILGNEGLNFSNPYTTRPIREKSPLYTAAEIEELHKKEVELAKNTTMDDKRKPLGNFNYETITRNQTTADVSNTRNMIMGLQQMANEGGELNKEEKKRLISEQRLAAAKGFVDGNGNITDSYWQDLTSRYSKTETVEGRDKDVPYTPPQWTVKTEENSNYSSNKDGSFTFGKGSTKATLVPKNELIRVGFDRQEGDVFWRKPLQEIGYPVVGAMDLNDATPIFYSGLIGDVAFEIVNGKAVPISTRDLGEGGFKMSQQVLIPTTKDGKMMTNKEVEAAKKKGEPVSAELYVKTRLPSKVSNKPDREILINTSRGMEQTLKQHKIPTTYDVTKQVYGDEKAEETPQTPIAKPQGKKTGSKTTTTDLGVKKEWKPKF